MTIQALSVQAMASCIYAELYKLSNEFFEIEAQHPEVWESESFCSAFDYFMDRSKSMSFDSISDAIHGIKEITKAHILLNKIANTAVKKYENSQVIYSKPQPLLHSKKELATGA